MADTTTTNLGLTKPGVGDVGGADLWGTKLNNNFDMIDSLLMPKAGGIFTNTIWVANADPQILLRDTNHTATKQTFKIANASGFWYLQSVTDTNSAWVRDHIVVNHDGGIALKGAIGVNAAISWDLSNYYMGYNGTGPYINLDANDYLIFDRAADTFILTIGSSNKLVVGASSATIGVPLAVNGSFQTNNGGYISANPANSLHGFVRLQSTATTSNAGYIEFGIGATRLGYIGYGVSGGRHQIVAENGALGYNFPQRPQSMGNDVWDAGNMPDPGWRTLARIKPGSAVATAPQAIPAGARQLRFTGSFMATAANGVPCLQFSSDGGATWYSGAGNYSVGQVWYTGASGGQLAALTYAPIGGGGDGTPFLRKSINVVFSLPDGTNRGDWTYTAGSWTSGVGNYVTSAAGVTGFANAPTHFRLLAVAGNVGVGTDITVEYL